MNKSQLRKILKNIASRYIDLEPSLNAGDGIDGFVGCLNNSDLRAYLLKSELCPCESELFEMLPLFQTAEGIIEQYTDMLDILSDYGMMQKKEVPKLRVV